MKSGINPFDSQEAKPYKNDPEILAMTNLVSAYQNNDICEFEKILRQNHRNIMDDPFIREHIEGTQPSYMILPSILSFFEFRFIEEHSYASLDKTHSTIHKNPYTLNFQGIERRC